MPDFEEKYSNLCKRMPDFFTRYDNEKEKYAKLHNQTFDELRPLYTEYIKYARILLAGNQLLEALGIKVKSL